MKFSPTRFAVVDQAGNLKVGGGSGEALCFSPEAFAPVALGENGMSIEPVKDHLARVYLEVTNQCNLECRTCIRNVWDEPLGLMRWEVFEQIVSGVQAFSPIPTVFFGGFGEPFVHPLIIAMIRRIKESGGAAELITNGILMTQDISEQLIDAGLDVLWISIDGVTPESYADVRLGAELPLVLENLAGLIRLKEEKELSKPRVGVASVAMRRNINDIPELIRMCSAKGVELISISNVLAYTQELREDVLYERALSEATCRLPGDAAQTRLLPMDMADQTIRAYQNAIDSNFRFPMLGGQAGQPTSQCPFLLKGSTSIRWDGELCPCLPLLHTHDSYLGKRLRRSHAYAFGNIEKSSLRELWDDADYSNFRQRLMEFDFSPCTFCNSCEMADENLEDCFGNRAPACGGCLWAQGLIQCP